MTLKTTFALGFVGICFLVLVYVSKLLMCLDLMQFYDISLNTLYCIGYCFILISLCSFIDRIDPLHINYNLMLTCIICSIPFVIYIFIFALAYIFPSTTTFFTTTVIFKCFIYLINIVFCICILFLYLHPYQLKKPTFTALSLFSTIFLILCISKAIITMFTDNIYILSDINIILNFSALISFSFALTCYKDILLACEDLSKSIKHNE